MDAADMIKEEKLKKSFILATLASTIAGTFITGFNLFDRVDEKRKQRKLDKGQNKKIKDLEKRLNEAHNNIVNNNNNLQQQQQQQQQDNRDRDNDDRDRDRDRDDNRGRGRDDDRDVRYSLQRGGPMVQREFDQHFARLGPKYGEGDLIAQTQLQSQVITLQSTVIKLLEDALYTGKPVDLKKLYNASEFAREGSIRALRDQYQRLMQQLPPDQLPRGSRRGRPIAALMRRTSSTPDFRDTTSTTSSTSSVTSSSAHTTDTTDSDQTTRPESYNRRSVGGALVRANDDPLFCRVAEDLQRSNRPVVTTSSGACPDCRNKLTSGDPSEARRPWRIDKEIVVKERSLPRTGELVKTVEDRGYIITSRFLDKCHREDGGFACFLCYRFRDRDTLCRWPESLVNHIAEKHDIRELEGDADIRDVSKTGRDRRRRRGSVHG